MESGENGERGRSDRERQTDSRQQTVRGNSESGSGLGSVFQVALAWEGPLSTHTQVLAVTPTGTNWHHLPGAWTVQLQCRGLGMAVQCSAVLMAVLGEFCNGDSTDSIGEDRVD